MEYGIKLVSAGDIKRIVELRIDIFKDVEMIKPGDEEVDLTELNTAYFEELFAKDCLCGCYEEIDGEIASIALAVILFFPPVNLRNQGKIGYIFNVFTHPKYRNEGKATRVTTKLIDELKQKGVSKIELNANETSKGIYEKIGFKAAGNHMVLTD